MDANQVQSKWAEAGSLVEAIPGPEKSEARIAVMAALLLGIKAPAVGAAGATIEAPVEPTVGAPKISSIRQLARYSRRKGVTGHEAVVLLAWFLRQSNRPITSPDCRESWSALTGTSSFAQTTILRAEERQWLEPVHGAEGRQWQLTGVGLNVALKLMSDIEEPVKA